MFEGRLKRYTLEVAKANSEDAKAFYFLEFIRDVFRNIQADNPYKLYPEIERSIHSDKTILIKGRMDAFLGNLIIEFESNLKQRKIEEATGQLKRYTAILWNNKGVIEYLCVATDGLNFFVYRPRSSKTEDFTENDIVLEAVDKFDVREVDPVTVYKRMDRYMLYQTLRSPTTEDIVNDFGSQSILLKDCMVILRRIWKSIKTEVSTIYNEWAKYLSMVYGSEVQNEELFFKHTYLATLAKLMVYSFYQENTLPTSKETINHILIGGVFRQYGIENFLVEDFFSWIANNKVVKEGLEISYRIIDGLASYDLTKLNQDVFKELYQQLVDPVERHDLGEYYTPDWLAESIVKEVIEVPDARVLDPACGSGTFLSAVIRHKLTLINKNPTEKVKSIVQTVFGIDIHPLAVLISKANYLMALGNLLSKKEGSIVIPVYMADSIVFPSPIRSIATFGKDGSEEVYLYKVDNKNNLMLPKSIVNSRIVDGIIDSIRDFVLKMVANPSFPTKGFQTFLEKKFRINVEQFEILLKTTNLLVELVKNDKDTIHAFILKNVYKPSTIGTFDILVGNPPWLSYRYIKNLERQDQVRNLIINEYDLFSTAGGRTVSNLELATLFLIVSAHTYLKNNGLVAFVMPRSVFSSEHHDEFRMQKFSKVILGIEAVWDLEHLKPLFNVPTCVILARKGVATKYPLYSKIIEGKLENKNVNLDTFTEAVNKKNVMLTESKLNMMNIGSRSSWVYQQEVICEGRTLKPTGSRYKEKVKRGAELTPRPLWFIEIKTHERFGTNLEEPLVESTRRSVERAKGEYKGITVSGRVEKNYIYATLLGSDIVPFYHLPLRPIILPLIPLSNSYRIVRVNDARARGHKALAEWLENAEEIWNKRRKEKLTKWDLYGLLDFRNQLTNQNPKTQFKVLYNRSGTFLTSCVVDTKELSIRVNDIEFKAQGFAADTTAYYFETNSEDEASYLAAVLNSKVVDRLIKPLQSRGLWGPRDIHKKPLELPIDDFHADNVKHRELARIGRKSTKIVKSALPQLLSQMRIESSTISPNAVGRLRTKIRELFAVEISEIDELVCDILTK